VIGQADIYFRRAGRIRNARRGSRAGGLRWQVLFATHRHKLCHLRSAWVMPISAAEARCPTAQRARLTGQVLALQKSFVFFTPSRGASRVDYLTCNPLQVSTESR